MEQPGGCCSLSRWIHFDTVYYFIYGAEVDPNWTRGMMMTPHCLLAFATVQIMQIMWIVWWVAPRPPTRAPSFRSYHFHFKSLQVDTKLCWTFLKKTIIWWAGTSCQKCGRKSERKKTGKRERTTANHSKTASVAEISDGTDDKPMIIYMLRCSLSSHEIF